MKLLTIFTSSAVLIATTNAGTILEFFSETDCKGTSQEIVLYPTNCTQLSAPAKSYQLISNAYAVPGEGYAAFSTSNCPDPTLGPDYLDSVNSAGRCGYGSAALSIGQCYPAIDPKGEPTRSIESYLLDSCQQA